MITPDQLSRWIEVERRGSVDISPRVLDRLARQINVLRLSQDGYYNPSLKSIAQAELDKAINRLNYDARALAELARQRLTAWLEAGVGESGDDWRGAHYEQVLVDLERALMPLGSPTKPSGREGQPPAWWHPFGRALGELIEAELRDGGFNGAKAAASSDSVTAILGAAVMNECFDCEPEITPRAFASANRDRDRRKGRASGP